MRSLAVSAGMGAPVPDSSLVSRGLQRLLVQKPMYMAFILWGYLFSSLGDIVRVTTMSQDPKLQACFNKLEEIPPQGALGVLGLSAGAPGCHEEGLHFQTSTHSSHSGYDVLC